MEIIEYNLFPLIFTCTIFSIITLIINYFYKILLVNVEYCENNKTILKYYLILAPILYGLGYLIGIIPLINFIIYFLFGIICGGTVGLFLRRVELHKIQNKME